jgi:hypothetical protein
MSLEQTVCARGSISTAFWCFSTKMVVQWLLVCAPFTIFVSYICPEVVPLLLIKMTGYSLFLAFFFTLVMMLGRVTADSVGLHYQNRLAFQRVSIPWQEIEFRRALPITLKRPQVIARRGGRETIKIWPSMTGYQELLACFARHHISPDKANSAQGKADFRPFDEVLNEALRPGGR